MFYRFFGYNFQCKVQAYIYRLGLALCTDGPYLIFYTVDYQYVKWYYTTRK